MRKIAVIFLGICAVFASASFAFAQSTTQQADQSTDDLQGELNVHKSEIDSINSKISDYQKRLTELSTKQAGLKKDIDIISNEVEVAQLNVQALQLTIESQKLEVEILDRQVQESTAQLKRQKTGLRDLVLEVNRAENTSPIEVVFSANGMHEALAGLQNLETLSGRLKTELDDTKSLRTDLQSRQDTQRDKVNELEDLQSELNARAIALDQRKHAADVLLKETGNSETQYRALVNQLQDEQRGITSRILEIQDQISKRIRAENGTTGEDDSQTIITSPLKSYVVTATFHDPTYPFRNIQEHTGLDMAAPLGTPIYAAAPGVVTIVRPGSTGYGNYVMIVHDNGLATLYGHMSAFAVTADQYIARGQVVGYIGVTGFTTGPHLHFEVRSNGIPVDPQAYLQ